MPDTPSPLTALLAAPTVLLAGTDVEIRLLLGRSLLNEMLAAGPSDGGVEEMMLDPEANNLVNMHLTLHAPIVGQVRRKLVLQPGAPVSFPDQPWLNFEITDGFRFIDKPVIKLMQGQLAEKLPAGVELTADYLRFHVPALLTAAGYQQFVPLIKSLRLTSEANQFVVNLHLVA